MLGRWLASRAAAHVLQTEGSRAALPPDFRDRAVVIPNPVEPLPNAILPGGRPCSLVAVGRLTPQKGFDLLIAAFAQVAHSHPEWHLTIFGDGAERGVLEQQVADLSLADRICLAGTTKAPCGWRAGADAFVLSSRFEGFPNVLGEAMAAGLPVVAFDCPWGPADLIEDGISGLLVAPEDVNALAAALDRVLGSEWLRASLGGAARRRVLRFAPDHVMTQWDHLLNRVQHPGPSRPCRAPQDPTLHAAHDG